MTRVNREEWVKSLNVGDTASATLPGESSPTVGKVTSVERLANGGEAPIYGVALGGKEYVFHGHDGHLAGHPGVILQPVATGKGGSVGDPMNVSNLASLAQARDERQRQENSG